MKMLLEQINTLTSTIKTLKSRVNNNRVRINRGGNRGGIRGGGKYFHQRNSVK